LEWRKNSTAGVPDDEEINFASLEGLAKYNDSDEDIDSDEEEEYKQENEDVDDDDMENQTTFLLSLQGP
jgi:hypothetical protein